MKPLATSIRTGTALLLTALALLWGVTWMLLHKELSRTYESARLDSTNLARVIAENEAGALHSIDLLVRYFAQEWARNRDTFPEVVRRHQEFLDRLSILQVAVTEKDGMMVFSSITGWSKVDLSDRPHIRVHMRRSSDEAYISSPVLGRVSKQWTIQFSRPVIDAQGNFAGVVVASIPPPALVRDYQAVQLGEGSAISLVRFDGQTMSRSSGLDKAAGVSLANTPGLDPKDPASGEYRRASMIDGVERLYNYQKVGDYPYTVYVGQAIETIEANYRRSQATFLVAASGTSLLMLMVFALFVSRVHREAEVHARQRHFDEEMRASEARFRLIAETIDSVVWSVDLQNAGAVYISPSYEKIWGVEIAEATPELSMLATHAVDEDRAAVLSDLQIDETSEGFEHEYRIQRPDGTLRWIWGRGFPVRDDAGRNIRFVGLAQDITVLKTTQGELNRLNRDLERRVEARTADLLAMNSILVAEKEQNKALIRKFEDAQMQLLQSEKMASLGQLAAGVAHEINNPVGFVNSNLGVLKTYFEDLFSLLDAYERCEAQLTAEQKDALGQVKQRIDIDYLREDLGKLYVESMDGLQRVKQIVQDLKDFSRIGNAEWTTANIEKGLESTINVAWNELKYKADVVREYAGIPEVECIPSQLNQVFMNLLVNAAHSIRERGRITVRTNETENDVRIEVSDTGCGIPSENLQRIFDPFYTTTPVGSGTGLGLSLSYGIVQKHGGRIEVESRVGEGSTFRVILPKRRQDGLAELSETVPDVSVSSPGGAVS